MFPDPRVCLPIGVNAKGPTPPNGIPKMGFENTLVSSRDSSAPQAGQTELTRARSVTNG